jgi:NAD(P)-dependent dehydrogenase (short-subunit alcohol dehydrogenase family)
VAVCVPDAADEPAADRAVADALAELGALHVLAVDGAGLFADACAQGSAGAPDTAPPGLRACMDATWNITRAVVNLAFLPAPGAVRRILYLAPAPDAGEHAGAVRAGLENLARTLSVEWARHGITAVTVAPGADTSAEEVAAMATYLASPAGAYFSGCLLDMRAVR